MANKKLKQIQVKETTYDIDVATSLKVTDLSAENLNENNVVTAGAVKSYAAKEGHTHPVQDSVSGNAGSADRLNTDAGGATQPVYFKDGVPVATTYALNKSVPADAKFTDEDTKNTAGATDTSSKIFLIGATEQTENPQTYSHDTAYVGTDGCLYSNSKKVSVEGHGTHVIYATANPGMDGTAAVGTSTKVSREDHIHPVDTSRAAASVVNDHIEDTSAHFTDTERTKLSGIEIGAQVNTITGVKGESETAYRTGKVNITKADIGLGNVNNTADADKEVKHAGTAGSATKATQDASGNPITTTYATKNELSTHDSATDAHADIRNTITSLSNQVQGLLDVDDSTLAKMEELLENLESSEDLIANKVDKSDIVDNTSTNDATKVLSARQGQALFTYIDGTTSNLASHTGDTTSHITAAERTKWNAAKTHADTAHAPSNAEANVQSDWNETDTSSDAFIKNKPTTMTPASHSHGNIGNGGTLDTANAVVITDSNKKLVASTAISTRELGFLDGVHTNIQEQLDRVVHKYTPAYEFLCEEKDDGTLALLEAWPEESDLIIPPTWEGKEITTIGVDGLGGGIADYIRTIVIPNTVTSIAGGAFQDCSSLTSITIPDSVTSIGEGAFYNCSSLTSVTIGNGVTSIGEYAFYGCSNLTSITIPDNVTSIGYAAFSGCSSLTSVTIGNGVTSIGNYAFDGCSNLTSVNIPDNVTRIWNCTFQDCSSLTSITIPDNVTSIGYAAFSGCSSLTSVTIGNGVTSIGEYAFYGCSNLTDIYYTGSEAEWSKITFDKSKNNETATIHYNHASNFIDLNTRITDLATKVTDNSTAFWSHDVILKNLIISQNKGLYYSDSYNGDDTKCAVTGWSGSFSGDLVIPRYSPDGKLVVAIDDSAFIGSGDLISLRVPSSVTIIKNYAFAECPNIKSVIFEENSQLRDIEEYAFADCQSLTSVVTDSVVNIGEGVFISCYNLANVVIGNKVSHISSYAFENCSNLASIIIPGSIKSIDDWAFDGCTSLAQVYYAGSEDEWSDICNNPGIESDSVIFGYAPDFISLHNRIQSLQSDLANNDQQISQAHNEITTIATTLDAVEGSILDLNESVIDLMTHKVTGYTKSLYNNTSGNPKPVKFATVNYTSCTKENGVAAKFGMRSGHGNGVSYVFDQDITINVDHNGGVSAIVFKNSGEATTYSGVSKQYGDVFYITNTSAKTVTFYCLMGQYSYLKMNTAEPLTSSSNAASGTVLTQHSGTGIAYSSGTITGWATTKQVGVQFSFDATSKTLTITT